MIFVAPFIIGLIAFFLMPPVNRVYYSFNKIGVGEQGGMTFEWIGIRNYIDLFAAKVTTDSQPMARLFTEENTSMALSVPLIVIFSLFMALQLFPRQCWDMPWPGWISPAEGWGLRWLSWRS